MLQRGSEREVPEQFVEDHRFRLQKYNLKF
jgi:hypothetical protein